MDAAPIRNSQAELMSAKRAAERDQKIDRSRVNQARKDACREDDALWLTTYLPSVFYNPFTDDQLETIKYAGYALRYGTSKCKAAPRGDGKSTILKYLTLKYALYRQIRFGLLICATGPKADDSLRSIKAKLRMAHGTPLADDFPFECTMARYVGPAPARANNATAAGGRPVRIEWAANRLILPSYLDDEPLGPIVMSLGYESDQLQGCNVEDIRPDFVLLDDLDSRQSLAAVDGTIAEKIGTIIDQTVGGLGGPGRRLGQFYLGTVTSRASAAYKYSDPLQKPAWSGTRTARIRKWPTNMELWNEYIAKRQDGQQRRIVPEDPTSGPVDPFGRVAHQFYVEHCEAMNEGADLSNPYDFDQDILPDGSQKHLSALQKCFDYIADKGMDSFLTEHQNDPPEDEGTEISGISIPLITSRTNEFGHQVVPDGCVLDAAIDVGMHRCHFVAPAHSADAAAFVVDYFFTDVRGTSSEEGQIHRMAQDDPRRQMAIEQAIVKTLHNMREALQNEPYRNQEGNVVVPRLIPVDSGSGVHTDAVYDFCRQVGKPYVPAKGVSPFYHGKESATRKVGEHCARVWQEKAKLWLYEFDADYWKRYVHERFLTQTYDDAGKYRRGSISLWQPEMAHRHTKFARQIEAELWTEKFKPGKTTNPKPGFVKMHKDNHFLDALAMSLMAASWGGVTVTLKPTKSRQVRSMQDMQAAARAG